MAEDVGSGNNIITGPGKLSGAGTVDLFGWNGASSATNHYGINNSVTAADYGNRAGDALKNEWGSQIGSGWRTLTKDEWNYLLTDRTAAEEKKGFATVDKISEAEHPTGRSDADGIILLPDDFIDPFAGTSYAFTPMDDIMGYSSNLYFTVNWQVMEAAGAVFLPSAGYREGTTHKDYDSVSGNYWSSTVNNAGSAYNLTFGSESITLDSRNRYQGVSVRLVHE
jgi:hypothetical protein